MKEHVKVSKIDPIVKCIVQDVVGSLHNRRTFLRICVNWRHYMIIK